MDNNAIAVTFAFMFLVAMISAVAEIQKAQANPIINIYRDISPPEGAQPPIITILTPQNNSFYSKNVTLAFDVTAPRMSGDQALDGITKIYFEASWETEETIVAENRLGSFSLDLSNVRGGNHSVTVYAVGVGYIETGTEYREENDVIVSYNHYDRFHMTSYSTVSFIKDLVPPMVSVLSPQNTTYTAPDVKLDFTVNEGVSQILYSLDNKENQTISGNATLAGLLNGEHSMTLYVADLAGNAVSSKTLFFNVNSPEPFPIVPVAIGIAISSIAGAGLLVYLKKRPSKTGDKT